MRSGVLLTAAAGPLSNLVLAAGCFGLYIVLASVGLGASEGAESFFRLLHIGILLNVNLALFNSLPVPPLDGSRVLDSLLPDRYRRTWDAVCANSSYLLVALILLPNLLGIRLFGWVAPLIGWLLGMALSLLGA